MGRIDTDGDGEIDWHEFRAFVHRHIYMYICMSVCLYVCMSVCIYIRI
jgi:hypothetical protein